MQLDKTRIAIRERSMLGICDVALFVTRSYIGPLLITFAIGAAPFVILNHFAIHWMADVDYRDYTNVQFITRMLRFVWVMGLLVFIQAPMASVFATMYLGEAVFTDQPSIRRVIKDCFRLSLPILICQGLVRVVLPTCAVIWLLNPADESNPIIEIVVLGFLSLWSGALRAFRPFINQVVLLERCPLFSRDANVRTISRRSSSLHGPGSGHLVARWLGCAILAAMMAISFFFMLVFLSGLFLNDWQPGALMIKICVPLSMWMTAAFFTVVNFLNYLDLRIRHEGWEVELRLRAEAARQSSETTT